MQQRRHALRSVFLKLVVCFIVMFLLRKHVRLTCVLNKLMVMMMYTLKLYFGTWEPKCGV